MIIRSLAYKFRPILAHKPHLSIRLDLSRCKLSSNVPEKIKPQTESLSAAYQFPIIPRDPVLHVKLKSISQEYHGVEATQFSDDIRWFPIFRFPYVNLCMLLVKFKVFLTFLSLFVGANQVYMFILNPQLGLFGATLVTGVTLAGMAFLGNFFRKFVCQMYTTEDTKFIRISRFTFFGERRDMILPTDLIVRITDNNSSLKGSFINLQTIKPEKLSKDEVEEFYDEIFKFSLYYGGVTDKDRFERALGRLLSRKLNF